MRHHTWRARTVDVLCSVLWLCCVLTPPHGAAAAPVTTVTTMANTSESPRGLYLDATSGALFFTQAHSLHRIDRNGTVALVAGSGSSGFNDGVGSGATFFNPWGIAASGTSDHNDLVLFVSDTDNHCLRRAKLATGVVSSFAGNCTVVGGVDGVGRNSRFDKPYGIVLVRNTTTGSEFLYVCDYGNYAIRRVDVNTSSVDTFAGSMGTGQYADGQRLAHARFTSPVDIAVDATGRWMYVTEYEHCVRSIDITGSGIVATLAGACYNYGVKDGVGQDARFFNPWGIAINRDGSAVYVSQYVNCSIRRVTTSGGVVTTVGNRTGCGSTRIDGPLPTAVFGQLHGIRHYDARTMDGGSRAVGGVVMEDAEEGLLVADVSFKALRRVVLPVMTASQSVSGSASLSSSVSSVHPSKSETNDDASTSQSSSSSQTSPSSQTSSSSRAMSLSAPVVSTSLSASRIIGAVTTIANTADAPNGVGVYVEAPTTLEDDVGATSGGVLFTLPHSVQRIGRDGMAQPVLWTTSPSTKAWGIAASTVAQECLFVSDYDRHCIYRINSTVPLSAGVLAGQCGDHGAVDGSGTNARFNYPAGVALFHNTTADEEYLYVADTANNVVRRVVVSTGEVTTFAGTAALAGTAGGPRSTKARFYSPYGIAVDPTGQNVYVADAYNHCVRKIDATGNDGMVTTLAGTCGGSGFLDGLGPAARFSDPLGITINDDGSYVFLAEFGNCAIRRISTANGNVTTVSGFFGCRTPTLVDGPLAIARFGVLYGIVYCGARCTTADGVETAEARLVVADNGNKAIRSIVLEAQSVQGETRTLTQTASLTTPTTSSATQAIASATRTASSATQAVASATRTASSATQAVASATRSAWSATQANASATRTTSISHSPSLGSCSTLLMVAQQVPNVQEGDDAIMHGCGDTLNASSAARSCVVLPMGTRSATTSPDSGRRVFWLAPTQRPQPDAVPVRLVVQLVASTSWLVRRRSERTDNATTLGLVVAAVAGRGSTTSYRAVSVLNEAPAFGSTTRWTLEAVCATEVVPIDIMIVWPPQESLSTAGQALIGVAAFGAAATGDPSDVSNAVSLAMMSLFSCSGEPPTLSSTAYLISVFFDFGGTAMAMGNLGLAAAAGLIHLLVNLTLAKWRGCGAFDDDMAFVRFPALSMIAAEFLIPGSAFGAVTNLVVGAAGDVAVGVVALVLIAATVAASQGVLRWLVLPRVVFQTYASYPLSTTAWWGVVEQRLFFPSGRWLPATLRARFQPLMGVMERRGCWLRVGQILLALCMAVGAGMSNGGGLQSSACVVAPIIASLYFLFATILTAVRPFRRPMDRVCVPLMYTLFGVVLILKYVSAARAADQVQLVLTAVQIWKSMASLWVTHRESTWAAGAASAMTVDGDTSMHGSVDDAHWSLPTVLEAEDDDGAMLPLYSVRTGDGMGDTTATVGVGSATPVQGDAALVPVVAAAPPPFEDIAAELERYNDKFWDARGRALQVAAAEDDTLAAMDDGGNDLLRMHRFL